MRVRTGNYIGTKILFQIIEKNMFCNWNILPLKHAEGLTRIV